MWTGVFVGAAVFFGLASACSSSDETPAPAPGSQGGAGGGGVTFGSGGAYVCSETQSDGCPCTAPTDRSSCSTRVDCTYLDCAGAGEVKATCTGTLWVVSARPCTPLPCDPNGPACAPNEGCASKYDGISTFYECKSCGTGPLACACFVDLCGRGCQSISGRQIYCSPY